MYKWTIKHKMIVLRKQLPFIKCPTYTKMPSYPFVENLSLKYCSNRNGIYYNFFLWGSSTNFFQANSTTTLRAVKFLIFTLPPWMYIFLDHSTHNFNQLELLRIKTKIVHREVHALPLVLESNQEDSVMVDGEQVIGFTRMGTKYTNQREWHETPCTLTDWFTSYISVVIIPR